MRLNIMKKRRISLTDGNKKRIKERKKKKANKNLTSLKRRKSLYEGFDKTQELFRNELTFNNLREFISVLLIFNYGQIIGHF